MIDSADGKRREILKRVVRVWSIGNDFADWSLPVTSIDKLSATCEKLRSSSSTMMSYLHHIMGKRGTNRSTLGICGCHSEFCKRSSMLPLFMPTCDRLALSVKGAHVKSSYLNSCRHPVRVRMSDTAIRDVVSIGTGWAAACTQPAVRQPPPARPPPPRQQWPNERLRSDSDGRARAWLLQRWTARIISCELDKTRWNRLGRGGDGAARWLADKMDSKPGQQQHQQQQLSQVSLQQRPLRANDSDGRALAHWPPSGPRPLAPCLRSSGLAFWALLPPGHR